MEEIEISDFALSEYNTFHQFVEETLGSFANREISDDVDDDIDDHHSSKPLWRLHLFQFPSLKRSLIIFRFHHCIADGITFGTIWYRLMDQKDDNPSFHKPIRNNKQSKASSVSNTLQTMMITLIQCIVLLIGAIYVIFKMLFFAVSTEPNTIFKCNLSQRKIVSFVSEGISLDKINQKRKSMQIRPTFNDFMLTTIAQSISKYLEEKKENIPQFVHLGIPVNVRDKTKNVDDTMLGNKIGAYLVRMPLDKEMGFQQKLKWIKKELDFVKKTPEAKMSHYGVKMVSIMPQWMVDWIGPRMTGGATLVATNVNGGSGGDVYLCGSKMIDVTAVVPPPMGVGLGYVVFSLNGKVMVSVGVDRNCYDDDTAKDLMRCLKTVLKEQDVLE